MVEFQSQRKMVRRENVKKTWGLILYLPVVLKLLLMRLQAKGRHKDEKDNMI